MAETRSVGHVLRGALAGVCLAVTVGVATVTSSHLPTAEAKPPTVPTDGQGYLNSPARCAPNQNAVLVGRTALSLVAICADGRGGFQYRGIRLADGAAVLLPAKALSDGCFGARADAIDYTVSSRALLLTRGPRVVRDETMVDSRDYRTDPSTPVVQQAADRRLG
ncbi:hypothetical protein MMAD_12970 [Mycolicibacterium madagascariense]|uniref:Serine/threonine protein kinase n=1 Tax=Mycolicibacterium madagascariense TaxID=212765 RepID=A0A7I7XC35_9MYCO|nr:hypothetical protein [Mycolicibacterium madagascariense]MCV7013555.1 hypothetical protein [Mycolicibacterium madagascariense]BBZ27002.1 hypothetical protein MMAD_12970 [Mycolicibacterium madagascariense]